MPIDYSKYPPNWNTEIRPRILERANNCCEVCGFVNGMTVCSYKENGLTVWVNPLFYDLIPVAYKEVKVVLTIAHLDHDEENHNVTDDRLKAMCQLCHLRYDADEKKKRKAIEKNKEGFYWVKFQNKWSIASYYNKLWWLTGAPESIPVQCFTEIGERVTRNIDK